MTHTRSKRLDDGRCWTQRRPPAGSSRRWPLVPSGLACEMACRSRARVPPVVLHSGHCDATARAHMVRASVSPRALRLCTGGANRRLFKAMGGLLNSSHAATTRLHILKRSAQLRRACFLDKLVHLVGGRAADGWVWSCSDISSVPLLARRRRSKAGLAFLVYKFLFCVTEFTGVFVQWPLNH